MTATAFLLDANLSPETASFLKPTFGFDVSDLMSRGLGRIRDVEVVDLAVRERRVVVTFDHDLGEIFHRGVRSGFGVIILRLDDQTVEPVSRALDRFSRIEAASIPLERSLVVVDEDRVRVVTRA